MILVILDRISSDEILDSDKDICIVCLNLDESTVDIFREESGNSIIYKTSEDCEGIPLISEYQFSTENVTEVHGNFYHNGRNICNNCFNKMLNKNEIYYVGLVDYMSV